MSTTRLFFRALRTALLFTAVGAVDGCGLISFDTTVDIAPQVVPGNPAAAAAGVPATVVMSQIALNSSDLPGDAGLADSVKLNHLTLTVTAPADATLDFLTELTLTVVAPSSSTLLTRQLAAGAPAKGARQMTLKATSDVDLLPYVSAGAFVQAVGTGTSPTVDTTVAGQAVLTVSL
ncbi:MAG TPA: hypothetical protein VH374_14275 [Polyangia bacterium]|jgi:hypothetical protein|nr:hypothetical protein [Polyangia bacterium]